MTLLRTFTKNLKEIAFIKVEPEFCRSLCHSSMIEQTQKKLIKKFKIRF